MSPDLPSKERLQEVLDCHFNWASDTTVGTPLCKNAGYAPEASYPTLGLRSIDSMCILYMCFLRHGSYEHYLSSSESNT